MLLLCKLADQWERFEERQEESHGRVHFLSICHCYFVVNFFLLHTRKLWYCIIIARICFTLIHTLQIDRQIERHLANTLKKWWTKRKVREEWNNHFLLKSAWKFFVWVFCASINANSCVLILEPVEFSRFTQHRDPFPLLMLHSCMSGT